MRKYDYYVSAVAYNRERSHIARLRVHSATAVGPSPVGVDMTRLEIIELIGEGKTFCTITKGNSDVWVVGAQLEVAQVTTHYLITKSEHKTTDILANLPRIPA